MRTQLRTGKRGSPPKIGHCPRRNGRDLAGYQTAAGPPPRHAGIENPHNQSEGRNGQKDPTDEGQRIRKKNALGGPQIPDDDRRRRGHPGLCDATRCLRDIIQRHVSDFRHRRIVPHNSPPHRGDLPVHGMGRQDGFLNPGDGDEPAGKSREQPSTNPPRRRGR